MMKFSFYLLTVSNILEPTSRTVLSASLFRVKRLIRTWSLISFKTLLNSLSYFNIFVGYCVLLYKIWVHDCRLYILKNMKLVMCVLTRPDADSFLAYSSMLAYIAFLVCSSTPLIIIYVNPTYFLTQLSLEVSWLRSLHYFMMQHSMTHH
jgi:hypothetical protein